MDKELMEKIKAAKTLEEAMAIAKELPRMELPEEETGNVGGGTGRIELNDTQAEKVVGGAGHYVKDAMGKEIWITLLDSGYVCGEDDLYDRALILENLAVSGFSMDVLIDVGTQIFSGVAKIDCDRALRLGGPAYLADCYRNAHGYHFCG